jgi:hypothetical protein
MEAAASTVVAASTDAPAIEGSAGAEGSLGEAASRDAVPWAGSLAAARLGAGRRAAASGVTRPFVVAVASVAEAASTVAAVSTAEAAPEVADAGKIEGN